MTGPHPAVAATRLALRRALREEDAVVLAAVSGGADSLALAAALAFETDPARPASADVRGTAVVIDHGLQPGSGRVANEAARTCRRLGLAAEVVRVEVPADGGGGPEARARDARYAALAQAAVSADADAILLGHTRDDQAEQVLLGLARGSGTRSLSGMSPARGPWRRPFLEIPRDITRAACAALDLPVWDDPHNEDPRYLRVRARRLLRSVEGEVPGVGAALARSAALLRDDADALDAVAAGVRARLGDPPWEVADLTDRLLPHPVAVRRRVWRLLAAERGVPLAALRASHLADLDALLDRWRGQGPVHLPGGVTGERGDGRVHLARRRDAPGTPRDTGRDGAPGVG